ncbi:acetyltransferase [Vibrio cholerae]|nr:acetyltransferase [Vibrio cholerae]
MLCLSLVVMRCQPLRRALVSLRKNHQKFTHKVLKIQPLSQGNRMKVVDI